MTVFLGGGQGVGDDFFHDGLELGVDLFEGPRQAVAVLAHLQAGDGHATGVGSLGRAVQHAVLLVDLDGLRGGRHVRTLDDHGHAVVHELLCGFAINLVLGGARQSDVALDGPHALAALVVLGARNALGVFLDAAALDFLDLLDDLDVDAVRVVDVAVGVGDGDDLGAQLLSLLSGVGGHVAGAGDHDGLALEGVVAQHAQGFLGVVAHAVTGGLGAGQGAAEFQTLTGQDAGVLVADALVLAEQVADLTTTDVDVAGGNVGELADVAAQLSHEGLAEAHDLSVGLALRVEVGTALAAAHRQRGQGVLENLLEAKELDDGLGHGRVEA